MATIAMNVCREQEVDHVWYGNPQLCHDIYDRYADYLSIVKGNRIHHPLNVISTVMSCVARSKKWERAGYISHLRTKYPVYRINKSM